MCTGFDPCTSPSRAPRCHTLARCVYVGLNVTRCQCPVGYRGDGVNSCVLDSQAEPPRSCAEENGGCSINAICSESRNAADKSVEISCTCKEKFAGKQSFENSFRAESVAFNFLSHIQHRAISRLYQTIHSKTLFTFTHVQVRFVKEL